MIEDWDSWCREHSDEDVRLRPIEPGDIDEVVRIVRLHDSDDGRAARTTFESWEFGSPDARNAYFVALAPTDRDDTGWRLAGLSGYGIDDLEARGIYWLGWTYVNPFLQGQGIGSRLMTLVLETLERLGGRKLYVSTSSLESYEHAVEFYRSHDFAREAVLDDYYRPGEDQIILSRSIDS